MTRRSTPKIAFNPLKGIKAEQVRNSSTVIEILKKEVVPSIEEALRTRQNLATLFEIDSAGCYLKMEQQDWVPALEECKKLHIVDENYLECAKIQKLIDRLTKEPTPTKKGRTYGKRVASNPTRDKLTA